MDRTINRNFHYIFRMKTVKVFFLQLRTMTSLLSVRDSFSLLFCKKKKHTHTLLHFSRMFSIIQGRESDSSTLNATLCFFAGWFKLTSLQHTFGDLWLSGGRFLCNQGPICLPVCLYNLYRFQLHTALASRDELTQLGRTSRMLCQTVCSDFTVRGENSLTQRRKINPKRLLF